jgi:hypothetical protein
MARSISISRDGDHRGGQHGAVCATIGDGANRAPSLEGFHESQTVSPERNDCVGHGVDG